VAIDRQMRNTGARMSDVASGTIDVGRPDGAGEGWQFGLRPAESVDAAYLEIVSGPDPSNGASAPEDDE
jgi:hypothetical protein